MLIHSSKQPQKNYQNRSFKNQDLTGADFSFADIRGADFTGANLTGAKFNYVLAGLTKSQIIRLFIITVILSIIAGLAVFVAVDAPIRFFNSKLVATNHFSSAIFIFIQLVNIGLLVVTIRQGILEAIKYSSYLVLLVATILPILATLGAVPIITNTYFRRLGMSEAPDWIVWLLNELRMFRYIDSDALDLSLIHI